MNMLLLMCILSILNIEDLKIVVLGSEYVIDVTNVNNIEYENDSMEFEILECGDETFIVFVSKYELVPKYTFTKFLEGVYSSEYKLKCKKERYKDDCKLIKKSLNKYQGLARGHKYNFLVSMTELYEYYYKCSSKIYKASGHYSLNELIKIGNEISERGNLTISIENCKYQIYSKYWLINYIKEIYNKAFNRVNNKCIVY